MRHWLTILLFVAACGDDNAERVVEPGPAEPWSYGECFLFSGSFQFPEPVRTPIIESVAQHCVYTEYTEGTFFQCFTNDIESLVASLPPDVSFERWLWARDGCGYVLCCENKPIDLPFSGVSNAAPGQ